MRTARREACLDWIDEIAEALRRFPPDPDGDLTQAALGSGFAGISLFFVYRHLATGREDDRDEAARYLDAAVAIASREAVSPSLLSGLTGIAWAVEHVRRVWDEDGSDPLEDADEAVAIMARSIQEARGEIDLLYGLGGLAVYAAERLPRAWARRTLESVVRGLSDQAQTRADGVAWEREDSDAAAPVLGRVLNLGVAHGLPGSIAVLAAALRAGCEEARPLIEGAVRALLAQRRHDGPPLYPAIVRRDGERAPSRPSWCYGDLGIACALQAAGRLNGRSDWIAAAVEAGLTAARQSPEPSTAAGVTLCHGAAGNALLFARLFDATRERAFRDAAVRWCLHLLAGRRRGEGVGGVLSDPPPHGYENWRNDPGFLIGASGVGLALLALSTPVEPAWDRLLLISPLRPHIPASAATPLPARKEEVAHT